MPALTLDNSRVEGLCLATFVTDTYFLINIFRVAVKSPAVSV